MAAKKLNRHGWNVAFTIHGHEFVAKRLTRAEAEALTTDVCVLFAQDEAMSRVAVRIDNPALKKQTAVMPKDRV